MAADTQQELFKFSYSYLSAFSRMFLDKNKLRSFDSGNELELFIIADLKLMETVKIIDNIIEEDLIHLGLF